MGRSKHLKRAAVAALAMAALTAPASAEQRGFTLTGFERIIVNGPFVVRIETGRGSSARAEGDSRAIDEISLQVTGRTLNVRRNVSNNWGGYPGERSGVATLYLTTHAVDQATLIGSGDLAIDRLSGGRVIASIGGNGRIAIGEIESEDVALNVTGAGVLEARGSADRVRVNVQGPGTVSAEGLTAESLRVDLTGPGLVEISAEREAEIVASGSGNVLVHGDAACTDRSIGAGQVVCEGFNSRRY